MFSISQIPMLRMATGRTMALLVLVLLPFPVSIPLALWLTGHRGLTSHPDLLSPLPDRSI